MTGPWLEINGQFATLEFVLDVEPRVGASALGLSLEAYYDVVERWAMGPGFIYGVRVDRQAGAITQAGA
jgi:hypothetical protein